MLVDGEERVGCREDLSGCHTRQLNRVILERVRQKDACDRVTVYMSQRCITLHRIPALLRLYALTTHNNSSDAIFFLSFSLYF